MKSTFSCRWRKKARFLKRCANRRQTSAGTLIPSAPPTLTAIEKRTKPCSISRRACGWPNSRH